MPIRPIIALALATSLSINPVALAMTPLINDPITAVVEYPPLVSAAIAYEPAVRITPPITEPETVPIEFTSNSSNGRCIGAIDYLTKYSPGWNVDRMARIMYRESRCNPLVRNRHSGSTGLLQIMPSNCPYIAEQLGESCTIAKLQNPLFNIRAATTLFEYDGYGPWAV